MAATSGTRIGWVDTAKAIAIVLVALAHAVQWTTLADLAPDFWNRINLVLILFRMPLFFLASGLFAASIVARPWPVLWRSRLALLVWALLLWTLIRFGYFSLAPDASGLDQTDPIELALTPIMPSNGLWFLFALALFFVVSKLLRGRLDWRIQLALALVLAVIFFARADTGNIAWNGIGRYFLFFLVGLHLRDRIMPAVERRSSLWALALGAVFVAMALPVFALQYRIPGITGVLVVASLCAVGAGLLVARRLDGMSAFRWLSTMGRHTLPIYVLHVLFVSAITTALTLWRGAGWLDAIAPALPVLVTVAAVAASLGFWRLTRDLPVLRYLYVAPRWFSGAERGAASPARDADAAGRPAASGPGSSGRS